MKHPFLKLFIITIFISSSSCNQESEKTSQGNFEKITDTIRAVSYTHLTLPTNREV